LKAAAAAMSTPQELSLARFWAPRYWPAWALWLAMHTAARLPFSWLPPIGKALGKVLRHVKRREHRTAERNLQVCFPELTAVEHERLLTLHFEAVGMSFLEMAIGWYWPIAKLLAIVRIEGREHLDRAFAGDRGVILVGGHFTSLEVGFAVLEAVCPRCSCMYRPQRNAMLDVMIRRGRRRFAQEQIPRDNVRALLRKLRGNYAVAYLPDQTYLGNQSEILPFFGEPAVTNIATSKLAKISGATVLPYFFRRLADGTGYVVNIGPALPNFPSDDAAADTRRLVHALEEYIRLAPEQYLWLYKKFKGRPEPHPNLYRNDGG
jgi:KDO2-lipid IV(A) lauroyltransferase